VERALKMVSTTNTNIVWEVLRCFVWRSEANDILSCI
jgi:hypothetical protein